MVKLLKLKLPKWNDGDILLLENVRFYPGEDKK